VPKKPVPSVKLYEVISRAVHAGALYGTGRLWKHRDELRVEDCEVYAEEIATAVLNELCEVIEF
jgi:hypothetical protein